MGIYIGIDPGVNGGYAIIEESIKDGSIMADAQVWDNANFLDAMSYVADKGGACVACVEKVASMPHQGSVSIFTFGKAAGYIEGALSALGIPYQLVPPRVWKKEFSLTANKSESIEVAEHLYPDVSLLKNERCRKKHDGMAEALLMAEYARRRMRASR